MTAPTATPAPTLREEVVDKIAALITVALGLVAALAWNSAIQATFALFFGTNGQIVSIYTSAVLVTVVAVLATIWIGRSASRAYALAQRDFVRKRPA